MAATNRWQAPIWQTVTVFSINAQVVQSKDNRDVQVSLAGYTEYVA